MGKKNLLPLDFIFVVFLFWLALANFYSINVWVWTVNVRFDNFSHYILIAFLFCILRMDSEQLL